MAWDCYLDSCLIHRRMVGFVVLVRVGVTAFVLCSSVRPRTLLGLGVDNVLVVVGTVAAEVRLGLLAL